MIKTNQVAIYGGSFDPIHNGHVHLIESVLSTGEFDLLIVVPAGLPWQRDIDANAKARLEMVSLALAPQLLIGGVELNDSEIKRKGNSYAIDTVREISARYPDSDITWVIGSDAFSGIASWHDIENLAKLTKFLVIQRPGKAIYEPPSYVDWSSRDIGALDISATEVRRRLRDDESVAELIPESVEMFIRENVLYGVA